MLGQGVWCRVYGLIVEGVGFDGVGCRVQGEGCRLEHAKSVQQLHATLKVAPPPQQGLGSRV